MLADLRVLLASVPADSASDGYARAVIDDNVLGKQTESTRRLATQRLRELYGLNPRLPIFRALRRVWGVDEPGRPLSALLCSLARDPLLRSTTEAVLGLHQGAELIRTVLLEAIRRSVGDRLNESVLDKVARNAASTWCQSGHLSGRIRKVRQRVNPSPGPLAFALWLGTLEGVAGEQLLRSRWARVLDRNAGELEPVVLRAKQLGLVTANIGGGTAEIDASRLDAPQPGN